MFAPLAIKPPWKSGVYWYGKNGPLNVHAVVPSLVMAATVPELVIANTSATPFGLGTAGTIRLAGNGLAHSTVPVENTPRGGAAETMTPAEAAPALMVTWPTARADKTG